jgi:signal transduction histidine kinase/CheY-like chemotaxis protein
VALRGHCLSENCVACHFPSAFVIILPFRLGTRRKTACATSEAYRFARMPFYVLIPTLLLGIALFLLLRRAQRKLFPFCLLDNVTITEVDARLDDGVYVALACFMTTVIPLTMTQISLWPNSDAYLLLNLALLAGYAVPAFLFVTGRWTRTTASRLTCVVHLLFVALGAFVSGRSSVQVVFDCYAVPVLFGHMAMLSSESFALGLLLQTTLYLSVVDALDLRYSGTPWFDYPSMERSGRLLPLTMAVTCLVHLTLKRVTAAYKAQRLADHFAKVDQQKDDFLCNVTHEIKSPLNGILGCAQLLIASGDNLTPQQREHLSVVVHCSTLLNLLVSNVLNLRREGIRRVPQDKVALRPYFEELYGLCKNLLYEHSELRFDMRLSEQLPASAVIPGAVLTPVVLNLVLNAAKHAASGQEVILSAKMESAGNLVCEVRDRGPGILDPDVMFSERPRQQNSGTSSPGTGLGLRVCMTMCESAGCRLSYRPAKAGGSVFSVTVPMGRELIKSSSKESPSARALTPSVSPVAPRLPGSAFEVLVVDDSTVNVKVCAGLLKRLGVDATHIHSACNGADALLFLLQRASAASPCRLLVLMDIQMPLLDGNDATKHWRELEKSLGVTPSFLVAVSAGHESTIDRGIFDATLAKPVMMAALAAIKDAFLQSAPM